MMTTALTAALIGALAIVSPTAAQTDFSGTWVLDTSRSEGLPTGIGQTMTIRQSGDRIEVVTHGTTPAGEPRISDDLYVLDGRETDFQPVLNIQAPATGKRTARWSEGGNGFESAERVTVEGPQGEITVLGTRKWTLAPGGDTLTIEMTNSSPQGEAKTTRVFTRQ